jgi:hypothetical protein
MQVRDREVKMPRRKRQLAKPSSGLATLRKEAQAIMKRLQRAGHRHLAAIERDIARLHRQREGILEELSAAVGGRLVRGRGDVGPSVRRRGRRARVNWDGVFTRLPKRSFQARDVRKLAPGVAAGTLSQRLTGWVKEKKLKRTGSRRGTRYTKVA